MRYLEIEDIGGQHAIFNPVNIEVFFERQEVLDHTSEEKVKEWVTCIGLASGLSIKTRESLASIEKRAKIERA